MNFFSLIFYITTQHRLVRVLSLTTSLVTPLNLVIAGFGSTKSLVDDNNDNSIEFGAVELFPIPTFPLLLHKLFVDVILCGAPMSEPFSDAALLRDWARCFFKFDNVVPALDATLWVSFHLIWISIVFYVPTKFCLFLIYRMWSP